MAQRIKEARKAVKFTQEELAKKLGVSLRTITRWENEASDNDPKLPWIKLANILEVTPQYLAGEVDAPTTDIKKRGPSQTAESLKQRRIETNADPPPQKQKKPLTLEVCPPKPGAFRYLLLSRSLSR